MPRLIPSLKAVRFFEMAAEHESFARAADNLNVSKGAVSQQIKKLEQYLGVILFRRTGRRLTLTDAGRRYHSAVRNAFNILEKETERIVGSKVRTQLKITALPAFASLWLVPRLSEFQKLMPHIDIILSAEAEVIDFSRSDAHLGVRYGTTEDDSLSATYLGHDTLTPVCTEGYSNKFSIKEPSDLSRCKLLHDTFWSDDWTRWLSKIDSTSSLGRDGQFFTHYSMAVDTARSGNGIAMGHELLLRASIDREELIRPLEHRIEATHGYYVVIPQRAAHLSYVKQFRDWLAESFCKTSSADAVLG